MKTTPRLQKKKAYHHGNLREVLVLEAYRLVQERGSEAVTLREIGRRSGVSHNAPYAHFATRQDLLAAVAAKGFDELRACLQPAVERAATDVEGALLAIGKSYVVFGVKNAQLFQLMFGPELGQARSETLRTSAMAAYSAIERIAEIATSQGLARPERQIALASWALVHGIVTLILEGNEKFPRQPKEIERLAGELCQVLIEGI